jgi:hypothetical protein
MVDDGEKFAHDPRIVVGAVEPAVDLDRLVDQRFDIGCLRDVSSNKVRLAARLADASQRLLAAFRIGIGDDDLCPLANKELGRRPADARASTSDKSNLVLQPVRNSCLLPIKQVKQVGSPHDRSTHRVQT